MQFTTVAASLALVASAFAAPALELDARGNTQCLSQSDAEALLARFVPAFQHLPDLSSARHTFQEILAPEFTEISDSILSLEGAPLGGASASTKKEYINGLLGNPPSTGIQTLLVAPVDCNSIIWQWTFTGVGDRQYEAKGFNLFKLNSQGQIKTLYVEFNSIAWALDTGYQIVFPSSSSSPPTSATATATGTPAPTATASTPATTAPATTPTVTPAPTATPV